MEVASSHSTGTGSVYLLFLCGGMLASGLALPCDNSGFQHQEMFDLSRPYDNNTVVWPGGEPFGFTKQQAEYRSPGNFFYAANDIKTAEHCGTHLDAPYHFNKEGWKVAEIPLERLITVGIFVNASEETNGNPQYKLPLSSLVEWEMKNGPLPPNSVLLISFGWSTRYADKSSYLGANGTLSFPGLSKESAEWIAKTNKVVGVGVDTASVDQGNNVEAHITLTGKQIYLLENVALTKPLPPVFNIIVMPMKLANGTGAPARIIALIDKKTTL